MLGLPVVPELDPEPPQGVGGAGGRDQKATAAETKSAKANAPATRYAIGKEVAIALVGPWLSHRRRRDVVGRHHQLRVRAGSLCRARR